MSTQQETALAEVDPLVLTVPASGGKVVAALALDAVVPLTFVSAAVVVFAIGVPALGVVLAVVAVVVLLATVLQIARTGRSLGGLALGTRTVRRVTGAAAGASLARALVTGDLGVFDLQRGRDPFAPALAPFEFPEHVPVAAPARPGRDRAPVVQLDSGQRLALASSLVIGRNPSAPADAPSEIYQWPDLSRTLSKSHTRFEWDGRRLWVTDLGSTNGTHVRSTDGGSQSLLPFQRTPLPVDVTVELGDRVVTVRSMS